MLGARRFSARRDTITADSSDTILHTLSQALTHQADHQMWTRAVALSERERDCLQQIAEGEQSKDIGMTMSVSYAMVAGHLRSARKKLGVPTTAAAVARGLLLGFLDPPPDPASDSHPGGQARGTAKAT